MSHGIARGKQNMGSGLVFKGGSQSEEFKGYIEQLSQNLRAFQDMTDAFEAPETSNDAGRLTALLDAFEQNSVKLQQAGALSLVFRHRTLAIRKRMNINHSCIS